MPDRKAERARIVGVLQSGRSIQMLAARRVGKTWLMHKVVDDLEALRWTTVFTDVEGMRTENEFLRELCKCIEEKVSAPQRIFSHLTHRLKQLTSGGWEGSPINAIGHVDPRAFSEALVAALDEQNEPTLILVDEIALFVSALLTQSESGTRDFLYHLRKLRQQYPKVRWLLTGSVGLDVVARRAGLHGALVDLEIFPLEPFGEAAARTYLVGLSTRREVPSPFEMDEAAFNYLLTELGWLSPYYLRFVAERVRPSSDLGASGLPIANLCDIEAAFEELLQPAYRAYFAAWEEHLEKNFPKGESDHLHAILNVLCEQSSGEVFDTLLAKVSPAHAIRPRELKNLLTALANDGFVIEAAGRWRFRSGLLRRYWLKYIHE